MKTAKELKDEYKQLKFAMGVFQIRNTVNEKVLIDSSYDMQAKWNRHEFELSFGNHKNLELQKDWKKFGEENFVFEILYELLPKEGQTDYQDEIKELEYMIIDEKEPFGDKGYNIKPKITTDKNLR